MTLTRECQLRCSRRGRGSRSSRSATAKPNRCLSMPVRREDLDDEAERRLNALPTRPRRPRPRIRYADGAVRRTLGARIAGYPRAHRDRARRPARPARSRHTAAARGDALQRARWRQAAAACAGLRHGQRAGCPTRTAGCARCGGGADPRLQPGPRRPAGDGRRRPAPRPPHLPSRLRRGHRDPHGRRAAGPRVRSARRSRRADPAQASRRAST